jgi:hypothetical protein
LAQAKGNTEYCLPYRTYHSGTNFLRVAITKRMSLNYGAPMHKWKSRMTIRRQKHLEVYFVAGITAKTSAELGGVYWNSAIFIDKWLRRIITLELTYASPVSGTIEVDESYG